MMGLVSFGKCGEFGACVEAKPAVLACILVKMPPSPDVFQRRSRLAIGLETRTF